MSDPIDRQAAIDTLNVGAELLRRVLDEADIVGVERAKYEWGLGLIEAYISDMKELPSAQPEPLTLRVNNELTKEEYDKLMQDIKDAPIVLLPSVQPEPSQVARDIATIIENEQDMMVIERNAQQWIPCSEPPKSDGFYIVYAPYYTGGSSTAKEHHDGVMFSKYKKGKWSIEHGYYNRDECVKAWMPLPLPYKGEQE